MNPKSYREAVFWLSIRGTTGERIGEFREFSDGEDFTMALPQCLSNANWYPAIALSPRGDLVAFATEANVDIWECATFAKVKSIPLQQGGVRRLYFSSNEQRVMAVLSNDSAIVVDILDKKHDQANMPVSDLLELLKGDDARTARMAIWQLSQLGDEVIPQLAKLVPEPIGDGVLKQLVANLDGSDPKVRDAAERLLSENVDRAIPILRDTLKTTTSLEQSARIEGILARTKTPIESRLQRGAARAIQVAESIGTDAACTFLVNMALANVNHRLKTRALSGAQRLESRRMQ